LTGRDVSIWFLDRSLGEILGLIGLFAAPSPPVRDFLDGSSQIVRSVRCRIIRF
jgi:hypothetical protein